jgi:hypothetical protein
MSSIFIQIASYHDYELPRTIRSAINKSSGNNIINFGISNCYFNKNNIIIPELSNIKYFESKGPENIGLGKSRLIAHSFYNDEDYYFQIDSHSRFDQNWDSNLISWIEEYKAMGFEKPLITNYPKSYFYEDFYIKKNKTGYVSNIAFSDPNNNFNQTCIALQTAYPIENSNIFSKSISGGSIFTVGDFIKPNPDIAFYGEEIFIAARAYTNGFDLLVPKEPFMYHLYFNHEDKISNLRRHVWEDFPDEFEKIDEISKKEIAAMFKQNKVGDGLLGQERSLKEFEKFTGLDFKNGVINT